MKLQVFWTDFLKILRYYLLRKSVWWEPSCSLQRDEETDIMKLTVGFSNLAKASKAGV
jgi:hypothetical protein